MEKLQLVIGSMDSAQIVIAVECREHPESADFWDGNWLVTQITVSIHPWRAKYYASLRADEFVAFRRQVEKLNDSLKDPAELAPMEPWIAFTLAPDELGHITVEGTATDMPGTGNTLKFKLEIDQSFLPEIIDQLKAIEKAYPIIGSP